MFPGFHSMLWHAHSATPPTLAFNIFKGFCLNISILFPLYKVLFTTGWGEPFPNMLNSWFWWLRTIWTSFLMWMLLMSILYLYYFNIMQVNLSVIHLFLFPPTNTCYLRNGLIKEYRVVQMGLIPSVFERTSCFLATLIKKKLCWLGNREGRRVRREELEAQCLFRNIYYSFFFSFLLCVFHLCRQWF